MEPKTRAFIFLQNKLSSMNFVIISINAYLLYGLELFLCCNLYDEYLNKWMF